MKGTSGRFHNREVSYPGPLPETKQTFNPGGGGQECV